MEHLARDLRLAARALARSPGFTTVALLCLALGIGANAAVFSFVDAVLLKPVPYREPERLVMVWNQFRALGPGNAYLSGHEFLDLRGETKVFQRTAAVIGQLLNLTGGGEPELCRAARVSADLFPLLGVPPLLGRTFLPQEDAVGQNRVVVLSHDFWQRRFGGDPAAVGSTMVLDGNPSTIVGVMPPEFRVLDLPQDFWVPIAMNLGNLPPREARGLMVVAQLKEGVSPAAAQAEMDLLARRLLLAYPASYPKDGSYGILVSPVAEELVGSTRPLLLALAAAVGLVLLIACANVASLLLARAVGRGKEMSIRAALGAGRGRVLSQLLAEGLLLALAGGALGLLLAFWTVGALKGMIPAAVSFPGLDRVGIDRRALLFTLLVAVATGVVFGLAPALKTFGSDLAATLREGGKTSGGGGARQPLRSALVVLEVALALMVLTGTGLLVRSLSRLSTVDPGFASEHLLTAPVYLSPLQYAQPEPIAAFYDAVLERARALPGVTAAGAVSQLPIAGDDQAANVFVDGRDAPGDPPRVVGFRSATPGYFRAMGIPVLQGRDFAAADRADSEPVVVVDDAAARSLFPGGSALGKRLRVDEPGPERWRTVVGVVGSVRHRVAAEAEPRIYLPAAQQPMLLMFLALRTAGDPAALAPALRAAIHEVGPDQPVGDVVPMATRVDRSLGRPRFATTLFGLFGTIALLLTLLGVYGLVAYSVAQRKQEIGVRMSLGAGRREILALVLRQGLLLLAAGIALGLAGALAGTRLLEKLLYGVGTRDAATFLAVPLLLLAAGLLATGLPALRATRVAPVVALRAE